MKWADSWIFEKVEFFKKIQKIALTKFLFQVSGWEKRGFYTENFHYIFRFCETKEKPYNKDRQIYQGKNLININEV